jgi:hypothetical protein
MLAIGKARRAAAAFYCPPIDSDAGDALASNDALLIEAIMATKKPRITVTLEHPIYEALRLLSDSSGQSMSGIIVEFLNAACPVFERMGAISSRVKEQQESERARFKEILISAQNDIEPYAISALDQMDLFLSKMDASAALNPRPVTTGVTPPLPTTPPLPSKPLKPTAHKASTGKAK